MGQFNNFSLCAYASPTSKALDEKPTSLDVVAGKTSYEFFAPFWFVQPTQNLANVNMRFETISINVSGSDWHQSEFNVTVLTNVCKLTEGGVLRYYQADSKVKYPAQDGLKKRKI